MSILCLISFNFIFPIPLQPSNDPQINITSESAFYLQFNDVFCPDVAALVDLINN